MAKKQSPGKKMAEKNLKARNHHWPNISDDMLWHRRRNVGYTMIPRAMPYFFRIMDDLYSGQPPSRTYFTLWCRLFDESFLEIKNPKELAFESGFSTQRAEYTWRTRMRILKELKFIKTKEGPSGEFNYVLVLNPYFVVRKLRQEGKIGPNNISYNALYSRAADIGADDLDVDLPKN